MNKENGSSRRHCKQWGLGGGGEKSQMINETEGLGGPYPPLPRPWCQELHIKLSGCFSCLVRKNLSHLRGLLYWGLEETKEKEALHSLTHKKRRRALQIGTDIYLAAHLSSCCIGWGHNNHLGFHQKKSLGHFLFIPFTS